MYTNDFFITFKRSFPALLFLDIATLCAFFAEKKEHASLIRKFPAS